MANYNSQTTEVEKPSKKETEQLIAEAQARFKLCEEAEHDLRIDALDDLEFRANANGSQWPEKHRMIREGSNPPRPCLTINVLPSRERQILNDQRQNRPAIHVNAVDDKGDEDTAEILQGLVRHIEYDSNADVAYDTGFAAAVRGGFGYLRVITEPESPYDFDQKLVIKIKRIRNAFSVYMDPNAQEPDYSDAKFGFIFSYYSRDEYKNQFPDSELASLDNWQGIGDRAPGWIEGKKTVRVAEYFCKRTKKVTLCQYADGSVEIKGEEAGDRQDPPTAEKEVEVPCVYCYKINAIEALDKRDWPGQWIPIIPVLGDELDVDGKRILEGMVRHTKDSIRMSNYMASAQVETIVQPNPPWIAPAGSIERFEKEWRNAGTAATTVLRYDPLPVGNTVAHPPERNTAEPAIVAISQARAAFVEDLKAITGIYDAQLGQKSNEISGKAINSRKEQGQVANFHYIDNLTRAIRHTGRILLDLIPKIYDTPRVLRIIGEDGAQKTVKVNQPFDVNGVQKIYDLRVGRYDVTVSSGPSYQTKRQEQAESIVDLTKASPIFMQACPDLIVQALDFAGHREMAERMKRFVNMQMPGLIQEDGEQDIPPQAQQMIQQLQQENKAIDMHAQQLGQALGQLQYEKQAKTQEMEYKERIELIHAESARLIAEINSNHQDIRERMKLDHDLDVKMKVAAFGMADSQEQRAHEVSLQQGQQAHEAASGAADAGHDAGMQQDSHGHESQMADKTHEHTLEQSEVQHLQGMEQQEQAGEQAIDQIKAKPKPAPKGNK